MYPCPNCKEIITIGTGSCRYCGEAIDKETAQRLNLDFQKVTDAIAGANTFKQTIWLAILFALVSPLYFLVLGGGSERVLLLSAAPIAAIGYILSWWRKYGRLVTSDMEYPDAVRDMRRSSVAWFAAMLIHVGVIWYALSSVFVR